MSVHSGLTAVWERVDGELLVTVELDGKESVVRVAPVGVASDNGCPSELEYTQQVEDAAWDAEVSCLACGTVEGDGFPYYDDHTCVSYERIVPRPLATEFPQPLVVGRPSWVRTEFTGHDAGDRLVELLDKGEVNDGWLANPSLDVFPTEWDMTVEWVDTHADEWVRLRHEVEDSRRDRQWEVALMMDPR